MRAVSRQILNETKNAHLIRWIHKAAKESLRCREITESEYQDIVSGIRVDVYFRRLNGSQLHMRPQSKPVVNDRLAAAWEDTKEILRRVASNHFWMLEQKGQSIAAWQREVREMGLTFSHQTLQAFRGGYARHRSVQLSWVVLLAKYWDMPPEVLMGRDFVMEELIEARK